MALTPEQLADLKPNQPSDPRPLAWWSFEGGKTDDLMGTFPATRLIGTPHLANGRLLLEGTNSYLAASRREQE